MDSLEDDIDTKIINEVNIDYETILADDNRIKMGEPQKGVPKNCRNEK